MGRGHADIEALRKALPRELAAAPWLPTEALIITIGVIRESAGSPVSLGQIRDHVRRMQVIGVRPHEMRTANGFGLVRHLDQLTRTGATRKTDGGYLLADAGETKLAQLRRTRPDVVEVFEKARCVDSTGSTMTLPARPHKNLLSRSFG